jgi:hypothetical protein
MNRRLFITLIPFLPALLNQSNNQIHIDAIKREAAKLKALTELTQIRHEVDRLHAQFKLDRAFYERH